MKSRLTGQGQYGNGTPSKLNGSMKYYQLSGLVLECLFGDWEVEGLIPGRVIPKTIKMVLIASLLGTQYLGFDYE